MGRPQCFRTLYVGHCPGPMTRETLERSSCVVSTNLRVTSNCSSRLHRCCSAAASACWLSDGVGLRSQGGRWTIDFSPRVSSTSESEAARPC